MSALNNHTGSIDRPKYSCALGGALATLSALPRTVPIVHASPGCALNLGYAIDAGAGYAGSGYSGGAALPSTNVCEEEIVFGGEGRLREQVEKTIELVDADLYIILSGCMVEMIGDDIVSVTRDTALRGRHVLAAETGGFRGNSYKGYDIVLSALFRDFVKKQCKKDSGLVNVIGLVPAYDVFYRGNLTIVRTLLEQLGLRVNTFFTESDRLEDLENAGEAALTIVLSDRFGVESAEVFQKIHGTPFITTGLPIGGEATARFLRRVAGTLGIGETKVKELIAREEDRYYKNLVRISNLYNDYDLQRYVIIVADSNYAPAFSGFVADDLGFLPELAVITDVIRPEEEAVVKTRFTEGREGLTPEIVFDRNEEQLLPLIKRHWALDHNDWYYDTMTPQVIIGSSFEIDLAADLGAPLLCAAYPVTNRVVMSRGYAAYSGAVTLAEDLLSVLIAAR
ncbi:MAG: hypothetical protein LBC62_05920 [Treponema sp.]|jgi:nitrogenase molybdenum-iron protein beta chain|nr:hypothetical protein [Treponema sp.]